MSSPDRAIITARAVNQAAGINSKAFNDRQEGPFLQPPLSACCAA